MKHTAWIVMFVSLRESPPIVLGAGLFGEPTPTTGGMIRPIPLDSFESDTFENAMELARRMLEHDTCAWLGEFKRERLRFYRETKR